MIKIIIISLGIILLIITSAYMYLTTSQNTKTPSIPIKTTQNISNQNNIEPYLLTKSKKTDIQIHQEQNIENKIGNQTGITVNINTNGSPVRNMSPEELRLFQQKIQKK